MKRKGFTLVELMVVMAVIAILAATALVAFTNVRKRARDARRTAYIAQYRTALENYYSNNSVTGYPSSGAGWILCSELETQFLLPGYLSGPLPASTNSTTCGYRQLQSGEDYIVWYTLEQGWSWAACSAAYEGGKSCRLISSTPPNCSLCP